MHVTSRFQFDPVPTAVQAGRTAVQSDPVLDDLTDSAKQDVVLVVSELVSNAVSASMSGRPVLVEITREVDTVRIKVVNDGDMDFDRAVFDLPGPDAAQGRGLGIVHLLARSVDVVSGNGSTTVTAVVDVGG